MGLYRAVLSALLFLSISTQFSRTSSELYNVIQSQDFNEIKKSKDIVAVSFIRSKPYDETFQENYKEAGDHLLDFGVYLGTVDCVLDPVSEYCLQKDAAHNVYVFRHGRFFVHLAYDTLFGVDAIVSNVLHLALLVQVPIISGLSNLQEKQDRLRGKKDIIFGYVPAVGSRADRAFMEVAFAYRHKYSFAVTTNRDVMVGAEEKKPSLGLNPDPEVAVLQCTVAEPKESCPWSKYHGPVTTESLALLMKILELPPVVDMFEGGESNPYKEHGIPAIYAVTDAANHQQTRSIIMDAKDAFRGNAAFVIIDRDLVKSDLELDSMSCIPACFVLQGHTEDTYAGKIRDGGDLRTFLEVSIHQVFSHLDDPTGRTIIEEIDDDEGELPEQERQDDHMQEATVHLRLALQPKESIIPSLTDKTFPEFTGQSHLTSVLFTMQWNPRSLAFLESFQAAAEGIMTFFMEDFGDPPLARVECSDWPDICDKSNVTVYPTVKMYRGQSDVATYGGVLDKKNILKSYLLYNLPNPVNLHGEEEVQMASKGTYPEEWIKDELTNFILAVIPDKFSEERAIFQQVVQELRGEYLFGLCTSKCAQEVHDSSPSNQKRPSLTIYKWNDPHDPKQRFMKKFTKDALEAFIREASLPVLPELTAATMPRYLAQQKPFVILFHAGDQISDKAAHSLRTLVTSKTYNQFILCYMDSSAEDSVGSQTLATYGFLPSPDQATVVILDHSVGEVCRYSHGNDPSESSLQTWLQAALGETKHCSEARALIDREWKPLVPPYNFLKFMEEEEHRTGARRRGLMTPPEEGSEEQEQEKDQGEDGVEDNEMKRVEVPREKKSHQQHIEL